MTLEEIRHQCDERDYLKLECDGQTRVLHYVLDYHKVPHRVKQGCVEMADDNYFEPHFWIELEVDGETYIVDYRARMWLGEEAPHGVFKPSDHPEATYEGCDCVMPVSDALFNILVTTGSGTFAELEKKL